MRSQVDSYSMLICSKYVRSFKDIINISFVNSKFKETMDKFHFNPFKINQKTRKFFSHLQTQWLFHAKNEIFSDGDISGYYVNYEVDYQKYLEMKDKYQNINFRRIVYTENDILNYGYEISDVVNKLDKFSFFGSDIREMEIPDSIIEIGNNYCFQDCESLTSITISSRLTKIGKYAFYNCGELESITLPSVLTSLNKSVFSYCSKLTTIEYSPFVVNLDDYLFKGNGFSTITIPSSITRIGDSCFSECNLTSLTIPSNVIHFGNNVFSNNFQLQEVELPNNMMQLTDGMFYNCYQLSKMNIPSSLTKIGDECFGNCNFSSLTIPSNVIYFGNNAFSNNFALQEVELQNNLKELSFEMFSQCSNLTKINIPSSMTKIGEKCFNKCKLTSLTIPSKVIHIGKCAVSNNKELKEVEIQNNMKELFEGMFFGCSNLTKINIPSSITKIGNECFYECLKLTIPTTLISQLHHIGNNCFNDNKGISEITLNNEITYIGDFAFSKNPIKSVIIPSSLSCLNSSFSECSELTHIEIPGSITCLGNYSFSNCINLKTLILPNSLTKIGEYSFYKCSSLECIVIPTLIKELPDGTFFECKSLTRIELPSSLTKIGNHCFYGCIKLKEINIPMSVVGIGIGIDAFKDCSELQSITGNVDVCTKF